MGKIIINAKEQNIYNLLGDNKINKGYVLRPSRYTTISGEDLINECARHASVPKSYAAATLEALAAMSITFLSNGHNVVLPNLGTLSLSIDSKAVADLKNVSLNNMVDLNIRFKPNHILKAEMDGVHYEIGTIYQIADEEVLEVDKDGKPVKTRKIYREVNKHEGDDTAEGGSNNNGSGSEQEEPGSGNGGNTNPGGGNGSSGDLEG